MPTVKRMKDNQDGATAIEYGLLTAIIAIAIIFSLKAVGGSLNSIFNNVATTINSGQ